MNTRDDIRIGKIFSGFKLERELGRGGMGAVYRAHELSLNRKVALKVLSEHLSSDEEFVKRFRREAQIIAALDHPNIVRVLSYGESEGLHFFAMEYIEGRDLGRILQEKGTLPVEEVMAIGVQVAGALSEAGARGVVHRDLKPGNIMIDTTGRAKVTDFGVGYLQDADTQLTRTGLFMGSPAYASPEQFEGDTLDIRSDIYSLGAVLYRILAGSPPITGDSPIAVITRIMTEDIPPIESVKPDLPPEICRIINKMVSRHIDKRYQTPEALMDDLQQFRRDLERNGNRVVGKKPEQAPDTEQAGLSARRFRNIGAMLGAALAVLLVFWISDAAFQKRQLADDPVSGVENGSAENRETVLPERENQSSVRKKIMQKTGGNGAEEPADEASGKMQAADGMAGATETPASSEEKDETSHTEAAETAAETREGAATGEKVVPPEKGGKVEIISGKTETPGDGGKSGAATAQAPVTAEKEEKQAALAKPDQLPASPTVVMVVGGTPEAVPVVKSFLEGIMFRQGFTVLPAGDVPGMGQYVQDTETRVTRDSLKDALPRDGGHILFFAETRQMGSTTLHYSGRTRELITANIALRAVDIKTGTLVCPPVNTSVKYTALNLQEKMEGALGNLTRRLAADIHDYWRLKRTSGQNGG